MKKYEIWIPDPISVNHAYATFRGHRIMTQAGRDYAGEWVFPPKTKPMNPSKVIVNEKVMKSGKNKGRTKVFVEGRCGKIFREAGLPQFPPKTKIVVRCEATWPNNIMRDMSSFQKLTEDVLQNGKFILNDQFLLWRNINFSIVKGVFGLKLEIFEKEIQ